MSDIEIAYAAKKKPIIELCEDLFGIPKERLEPYGHHKAKYVIDEESLKSDLEGNLIKPSGAEFIRREVIVADLISSTRDPQNLVGQTIFKSTDTSTNASVSEVEILKRDQKIYYKISLL